MEFLEFMKKLEQNKHFIINKYIFERLPIWISEDDILQELYLYFFEKYKKGYFNGKNQTFLFNCARFFLKNYLRKNRKMEIFSIDEINFEISEKTKNLDFYLPESIFTDKEKQVLNFLEEGYTLREIGKILKISHVAVLKIKKNIREKVTKFEKNLL